MAIQDSTPTLSLSVEAATSPSAAQRQIKEARSGFLEAARFLQNSTPHFISICARGSSKHASVYGKSLIETMTGKAVAFLSPNLSSIYNKQLDLSGSLFVVVSQSGKSPDLLAMTENAKKSGAMTLGFINETTSPLFSLCDLSIPLFAGKEYSIAATKSFILSAFAFLQLTAYWKNDSFLQETIQQAPDLFHQATELNWKEPLLQLTQALDMFTIGRGIGQGIASEFALKMKEVCGLHAEPFSAAEVIHGPLALVKSGFPSLFLGQKDLAESSIIETQKRFIEAGSLVLSTLPQPGTIPLPALHKNALLEPLCQALSLYMSISDLARARGLDPERPPHLKKVTETV